MRPQLASLSGELGDIRRQLKNLAIGNPLNRASIRDPDTGLELPLVALAFGLKSAKTDYVELTANSPSFVAQDTAGRTGPTVSVKVASGRMIALVSGLVVVSGNKATMSYGLDVSGPTPRPADPAEALEAHMDTDGMQQRMNATRAILYEDLLPGEYTLRSMFRLNGAVGQPSGIFGSVTLPTLIVLPF